MPRKSPVYDVTRCQDGALVVIGVPLAVARSEADRLNAESKVINPDTGRPTGMHLGDVCRFEVRKEGRVI